MAGMTTSPQQKHNGGDYAPKMRKGKSKDSSVNIESHKSFFHRWAEHSWKAMRSLVTPHHKVKKRRRRMLARSTGQLLENEKRTDAHPNLVERAKTDVLVSADECGDVAFDSHHASEEHPIKHHYPVPPVLTVFTRHPRNAARVEALHASTPHRKPTPDPDDECMLDSHRDAFPNVMKEVARLEEKATNADSMTSLECSMLEVARTTRSVSLLAKKFEKITEDANHVPVEFLNKPRRTHYASAIEAHSHEWLLQGMKYHPSVQEKVSEGDIAGSHRLPSPAIHGWEKGRVENNEEQDNVSGRIIAQSSRSDSLPSETVLALEKIASQCVQGREDAQIQTDIWSKVVRFADVPVECCIHHPAVCVCGDSIPLEDADITERPQLRVLEKKGSTTVDGLLCNVHLHGADHGQAETMHIRGSAANRQDGTAVGGEIKETQEDMLHRTATGTVFADGSSQTHGDLCMDHELKTPEKLDHPLHCSATKFPAGPSRKQVNLLFVDESCSKPRAPCRCSLCSAEPKAPCHCSLCSTKPQAACRCSLCGSKGAVCSCTLCTSEGAACSCTLCSSKGATCRCSLCLTEYPCRCSLCCTECRPNCHCSLCSRTARQVKSILSTNLDDSQESQTKENAHERSSVHSSEASEDVPEYKSLADQKEIEVNEGTGELKSAHSNTGKNIALEEMHKLSPASSDHTDASDNDKHLERSFTGTLKLVSLHPTYRRRCASKESQDSMNRADALLHAKSCEAEVGGHPTKPSSDKDVEETVSVTPDGSKTSSLGRKSESESSKHTAAEEETHDCSTNACSTAPHLRSSRDSASGAAAEAVNMELKEKHGEAKEASKKRGGESGEPKGATTGRKKHESDTLQQQAQPKIHFHKPGSQRSGRNSSKPKATASAKGLRRIFNFSSNNSYENKKVIRGEVCVDNDLAEYDDAAESTC